MHESENMVQKQTILILHCHSSTLAFGLPWNVDTIAMVVGKIEQGSGMASIKDGLKDTAKGV
jgi:hypothetical protein